MRCRRNDQISRPRIRHDGPVRDQYGKMGNQVDFLMAAWTTEKVAAVVISSSGFVHAPSNNPPVAAFR
jgi:hypothetical protein